jgi:hypothetical protein
MPRRRAAPRPGSLATGRQPRASSLLSSQPKRTGLCRGMPAARSDEYQAFLQLATLQMKRSTGGQHQTCCEETYFDHGNLLTLARDHFRSMCRAAGARWAFWRRSPTARQHAVGVISHDGGFWGDSMPVCAVYRALRFLASKKQLRTDATNRRMLGSLSRARAQPSRHVELLRQGVRSSAFAVQHPMQRPPEFSASFRRWRAPQSRR